MVRKWSYLTELPIDLSSNNRGLSYLTLRYNFKVFRTTTKFRTYNLGYTVMTRKKYSRRRHKTNWVTLLYILRYWVFFFLKSRQFVRFYQNIGLFSFKTYATDFSFFNKKLQDIDNVGGINSYSCSKRIIHGFLDRTRKVGPGFLTSPLRDSRYGGIMVHKNESLGLSEGIAPGLVSYDGLLYDYWFVSDPKNLKPHIDVSYVIFKQTLSLVIMYYKILIMLSLYNKKRLV